MTPIVILVLYTVFSTNPDSITRGVYLNPYKACSKDFLTKIFDYADAGYINTIVVDLKGDYGKYLIYDLTGKLVEYDIIEGKKTYLIILAKELAYNQKDRQLIDLFMKNNGLSEEFIPQMQELIKRVGAFEKSKEVADDYFNKAAKSLDTLKQNQYTDTLYWLLERLKKRNY